MGNSQAGEQTGKDVRQGENNEGAHLNPAVHITTPVGYRVLGVQSNSPCSNLGFVAFFDFIIAANGVPLRTLDTTFLELIKGSEDKPLPLSVYNTKNHTLRELVVVPSRRWAGEGLLGLTIRFDSFKGADEHMLHVLEVARDSPADIAGLQPMDDYLLGTAEKVFSDTEVLEAELSAHLDRPVEFFVYNVQTDEVRVCVLMPSQDWGTGGAGDGVLGAQVGQGYLHTLPASACETLGHSHESVAGRQAASVFGYHTLEPPPTQAPVPAPATEVTAGSADVESGGVPE